MNIEILFEEFYGYGEKANVDYLKLMFSKAKFYNTSFLDEPFFANNRPDIIVIEPIAEKMQPKILEKLLPYRDRLKELIEDGVYFFAFGNSLDLFGDSLEEVGFGKRETLKLFEYTTVRDYMNRIVELVPVNFKGETILATNIAFSQYFGNEYNYFYEAITGHGFNQKTKFGGYRYKNAFLTELIGNLFIYNPPLSKMLMDKFGCNESLPLEKEVNNSYNHRLKAWKDDKIL